MDESVEISKRIRVQVIDDIDRILSSNAFKPLYFIGLDALQLVEQ